MTHSHVRLGAGVLTLLAASIGGLAAAPPASAAQDTTCMRAGIATLKQAGLLQSVARDGLPISVAVSVGVTPRPGTDVASLPDPLPFAVVLADHRAGDESLFVYPWC
jgi:hypothetical protein